MGFKVPRRQARITFEEGHDYYGAEVTLNLDVPMAFLFEFERTRAADTEAAVRMFVESILAEWNVEDDAGQPIPATYDGAKTQPPAFIRALMDRWVTEGTAAPAPLEQTSSDSGTSVVPLARTANG